MRQIADEPGARAPQRIGPVERRSAPDVGIRGRARVHARAAITTHPEHRVLARSEVEAFEPGEPPAGAKLTLVAPHHHEAAAHRVARGHTTLDPRHLEHVAIGSGRVVAHRHRVELEDHSASARRAPVAAGPRRGVEDDAGAIQQTKRHLIGDGPASGKRDVRRDRHVGCRRAAVVEQNRCAGGRKRLRFRQCPCQPEIAADITRAPAERDREATRAIGRGTGVDRGDIHYAAVADNRHGDHATISRGSRIAPPGGEPDLSRRGSSGAGGEAHVFGCRRSGRQPYAVGGRRTAAGNGRAGTRASELNRGGISAAVRDHEVLHARRARIHAKAGRMWRDRDRREGRRGRRRADVHGDDTRHWRLPIIRRESDRADTRSAPRMVVNDDMR